jgi:hypothetical protein
LTNTQKSQQAEIANLEEEGVYESERDERQHLHELEDMITDITTALDSSLDLCSTLRSKFSEFQIRGQSPLERSGDTKDTELFIESLDEKERELRHHRYQADLMHVKIRSAATLVFSVIACYKLILTSLPANEYS